MYNFLTKEYQKKIYLTIILFVFHNFILSYIVGYDISFFIIIIISTLVTIYIKKEFIINDIVNKYSAIFSIYFIVLFLLLIYIFPTDIKDIVDNIFLFGMREELFFRYFMVGILINPKKDISRKGLLKILIMLTMINIMFMMNHDYPLILKLLVFTLGGLFSIIFLFCGLIPSIISHAIHNLYFNNPYSFIINILIILPIVLSPHFTKIYTEMRTRAPESTA